jgi:DNA replication protein DnaC
MSATPDLTPLLHQLRLPTLRADYRDLADMARRESWSYEQYLGALLQAEIDGRRTRRIQRLLSQSNLPADKTLATLDLELLPASVRPHLAACSRATS